MSLHKSFIAQAQFQRYINAHLGDIDDIEEKINGIVYMKTALEAELNELLQEIGWKPWASSRHINYEAAKSELVDTFQFFMNLCFAVGMTADELLERHAEKLKINYERANGGYDGVSTKCGWCGRALDDKHVSCDSPTSETGYCALKATETGDGFFTAKDLEMRK